MSVALVTRYSSIKTTLTGTLNSIASLRSSSTTPSSNYFIKMTTFHYLNIGRLGRGEVVNLFLKDAVVDFKEVRHAYDDTWPATSQKLKEQGITRTGKVPSVQHNGTYVTQHIPTLRYLARELGGYDGETSLEKYQVDAVADIYIDWRAAWVPNLSGLSEDFKNSTVPEYYKILAQYYEDDKSGPYLLGNKISYADFAVYQSIDNNERIGVKATLPPALATFREAFEARSNIAAYIKDNKVE